MLIVAAWCGLAAGELEVAVRVGQRLLSPTNRLYMMTRHFFWLVPVTSGLLFLVFGAVFRALTWRWPLRGGWIGLRLILVWAILPTVLLVGRGIYAEAKILLAMGLAVVFARVLERALAGRRRWLGWSAAVLAGAVLIQGGWIVGGEALRRWREAARPLPPPDSPNVLLVVLDTVRADHLSVYGYERPTTPNLEAMARRSVRFNQAACSSALDARLARHPLHGAVAARAGHALVAPDARRCAHAGRVPRLARLRHGGLRRQHVLLRL